MTLWSLLKTYFQMKACGACVGVRLARGPRSVAMRLSPAWSPTGGGVGERAVELGRGHDVHLARASGSGRGRSARRRRSRSRRARFGVNQISMVMPGIASCFTRKLGRKKLWITSIERTCTRTGRSFGQVRAGSAGRTSSLAAGSSLIEADRVVLRGERGGRCLPKHAVLARVADVPGELLARDLDRARRPRAAAPVTCAHRLSALKRKMSRITGGDQRPGPLQPGLSCQ